MHVFIDETGDLGFDFQKSKTSKFFTLTVLVCEDVQSVKAIYNAVKKTLNNRINHKKNRKNFRNELKGNNTDTNVKKYFYKRIQACMSWQLYSITLNKMLLLKKMNFLPNHHRIYNVLTHQLLIKIDFSEVLVVNLIIDKSKRKFHLQEFNKYLTTSLGITLPFNTDLCISHIPSEKNRGIQAVDVFTYGFHRKYEYKDTRWYDLFKERIRVECNYKVSGK